MSRGGGFRGLHVRPFRGPRGKTSLDRRTRASPPARPLPRAAKLHADRSNARAAPFPYYNAVFMPEPAEVRHPPSAAAAIFASFVLPFLARRYLSGGGDPPARRGARAKKGVFEAQNAANRYCPASASATLPAQPSRAASARYSTVIVDSSPPRGVNLPWSVAHTGRAARTISASIRLTTFS